MDALFIETLRKNHVAAWNEKDSTKREGLLKTIYSDGIKMYDPEKIVQGISEISLFIERLHAREGGFLFSEARPIDFIQNGVRLFGHIGTPENPNILNSMDFFIIENGKAAHLFVFLEPVK